MVIKFFVDDYFKHTSLANNGHRIYGGIELKMSGSYPVSQ